MKKHLFLIIISCLANNLIAQEIKVRDIVELTTDITARRAARQDNNGKECAVVRVNIPTIKTIHFESIVGDVTYLAGEYILYISEGTQQIPYSVDGYKGGVIDFDKYDISVTSKSVYRTTLYISREDKGTQASYCTLKLSTEPMSVLVLIDGIPVGESPLIIDNLQSGEHVISFPNSIHNMPDKDDGTYSGYTLSDQTITLKAGETLEKHFALEKKPLIDMQEHIELSGSDNDGTGWWPVKYRVKRKNGKKGLVDYWNREVVPCEYDYVDKNSIGKIFEVGKYDENDNYQISLFKPGQGLLFPFGKYSYFVIDKSPLIRARKNGLWGLLDYDGNEVVPCTFTTIEDKKCGVYVVYKEEKIAGKANEKYGLLGADGHTIIEPKYDFITCFSEGYAAVRDFDGIAYLIDSLGHTTSIPTGYHPEWSNYFPEYMGGCYTEGLLCLKKDEKFGVLNKSGKEVVPFIYDEKSLLKDGWCVLKRRDKENKKEEYIAIDKNEHIYRLTEHPHLEGRYINLERDGKHGLIDQNGKTVLPFEYDYIGERGSYMVTQKSGMTYILDNNFKECLSYESDDNLWTGSIKDGIIMLWDKESNRYGYMNMKGEILAGCLYENVTEKNFFKMGGNDYFIIHGLALLCAGERCGYMDNEGRIVVPLIYSTIVTFDDGTVYALKLDGVWEELNLEKLKK